MPKKRPSRKITIVDENIFQSTGQLGTTATSEDIYFSNSPDYSLGEEHARSNLDGSTEETMRIKVFLSHTSIRIQDYIEFKAARSIQRYFRGYVARQAFLRKRQAAIKLQSVWRGFSYRYHYYGTLEEKTQQAAIKHYNDMATRIQSIWRGWWVRENIHDQKRMTRRQIGTAEDLLYCIAFKLHHLLRTHQIPGIYSLRNSHKLSKVEQLLAAMKFKQQNDRVRLARAQREAEVGNAKLKFEKDRYGTEVPFSGPNYSSYCEQRACNNFTITDIDRNMSKILSLYEREATIDPRVKRARHKSKRKAEPPPKVKPVPQTSDFCGDVVNSMRKWSILTENGVVIEDSVFKKPENVERFLREIQSIQSMMEDHCHCKIQPGRPTCSQD